MRILSILIVFLCTNDVIAQSWYSDGGNNNDGTMDQFDNDRDNDGIMNQFDNDADNDGIMNQFDNDRDNDGTMDQFDNDDGWPRVTIRNKS